MNPSAEDRHSEVYKRNPSYQAYQLLRIAFTLAPLLAGLDKFFYFLTPWHQYLSNAFNLFGNAQTTMMVVGIIEIVVAIGVFFKPKVFAYVVAIWLLAIVINLLITGHYDIALRDFGLMLGALALARLSILYNVAQKR